jgi:ABC-type uncharacterized transport system fused permease/ATPase subunit
MNDQQAYLRAKERVESKISFYLHLAVYIVVNILLIIINLATSTGYLWFKWPLIGWGIAIGFHALMTFVFSGGSLIKEQMIEREMKRMTEKNKKSSAD